MRTMRILHNHNEDYSPIDHDHEGTYLESFDVIDDVTPQLGGNLDVNGKVITSASNGAVEITPNGTGMLKLGKGAYFSDYIDNGTAAATIDWRLSNKQLIRPDGNRAYTFTAPAGVTSLTLVITVGASRTLTCQQQCHGVVAHRHNMLRNVHSHVFLEWHKLFRHLHGEGIGHGTDTHCIFFE